MMTNLSRDLVEEILSRVPITSLEAVRSTCKLWNALSKDGILCNAQAKHQFMGFMMKKHRLYSMRFNLHGILSEDGEEFVNPSIKEVDSLLNQVEIVNVFHCDGLLLCATRDHTRLVVSNPYLGQTRWIHPRNVYHILDRYAIGYDKSSNNRNYKILRVLDLFEVEIYDFFSDSWRLLNITHDCYILFHQRGVSLKGNTYFLAKKKLDSEMPRSLVCFDFTTERFGKFLPLPFQQRDTDIESLSLLNDERFAALHHNTFTVEMEIWVTTKIEPNALSWTNFLRVNMYPLIGILNHTLSDSFFIDEENKLAVVLDLDDPVQIMNPCNSIAHIIGENGYLKQVNLGEAVNRRHESTNPEEYPPFCVPLLCSCSYVPSLVQITKSTSSTLLVRHGTSNPRSDSYRFIRVFACSD